MRLLAAPGCEDLWAEYIPISKLIDKKLPAGRKREAKTLVAGEGGRACSLPEVREALDGLLRSVDVVAETGEAAGGAGVRGPVGRGDPDLDHP